MESVQLALVGCGYWGANLARNFHALGSLAALHDRDVSAAERLSESIGVPARSFEAILADPEIHAVALATPPDTHAELAMVALGAGKDVFAEKPLALRVEDAKQVVKRAKELERILMVGHLLRYHPAFAEIESLVRSGSLGRLRYVYSNRLNFGRIRKVENILWSFSPHDLSMILSLIGSEPDRVWAVGAAYLQPGINDVTTTHLSFPGGEAAHVYVSWLHPYKEQKLVVIGDQGMAVFDDTEPWESKVSVYAHEVSWRDGNPETLKAAARPIPLAEQEPLLNECTHFLQCVATRNQPITDGDEAIRVLRVLELAERSMESQDTSIATSSSDGTGLIAYPGGALIHTTAIVDPNVEIGANSKVWHFAHILSGTRIGHDCIFGQNVMVGPDVIIGNGCKVQNNVSLYKGVVFEDDVFCGPSAVFTNVRTPRSEIERRADFECTIVRRGASIGANATIVCGNEIGAYSLVGAGAVVTRDVVPYALVLGNPAKQVGWVSAYGERLGPDLVCPRSGRRYAERDGHLVDITDE